MRSLGRWPLLLVAAVACRANDAPAPAKTFPDAFTPESDLPEHEIVRVEGQTPAYSATNGSHLSLIHI